MLTLIFQLIVAYVVFRLLRRLFLSLGSARPPAERPKRGDLSAPTVLSSCPRCGTFFQESQGVRGSRGALFCSPPCRDGKT